MIYRQNRPQQSNGNELEGKMDFGGVLSKAWKIVWKYKVLWIFGLLAALGEGNGGGGGGGGGRGGSFNNGSQGFNPPNFQQGQYNFDLMPPELARGLENFVNTVTHIQWYVWVMIGLGVLFLVLICWLLSMVGKIGLVKGSQLADEGEEKLPFVALLNKVWPYYGKFILLELLVWAAGFVIALVIAIPLVFLAVFTLGIGLLCILPLICLLIPVSLLVNTFVKQAEIALVADNLGVFDSIKAAWNVMKKNIWSYVIMTLILILIEFVAGIVIALPFILVFIPPFVAMAANGFTSFDGLGTSAIVSAVLCCFLVPIAWLASGILTAYDHAAWTLTYLRLKQPKTELPEVVAVETPNA